MGFLGYNGKAIQWHWAFSLIWFLDLWFIAQWVNALNEWIHLPVIVTSVLSMFESGKFGSAKISPGLSVNAKTLNSNLYRPPCSAWTPSVFLHRCTCTKSTLTLSSSFLAHSYYVRSSSSFVKFRVSVGTELNLSILAQKWHAIMQFCFFDWS